MNGELHDLYLTLTAISLFKEGKRYDCREF